MNPLCDDYASLFLEGTPLLDLRAPAEFATGAVPAATNLPLMSDDERAVVGTCYKQQGQAAAIELGYRLVSGTVREARMTAWLEYFHRHPDGMIYCARGGLRSETVQNWLAAAGCRRPRVVGGYKALRRFLIDNLERISASWPLWLLTGLTGCGKTDLLVTLEWAVDLEAHARHRGSSFGGMPEPQPGNIDFENGLAIELLRREAGGQQVWILEDESRMIGSCCLPLPLFEAMRRAPLVVLECSPEERITRIEQQYVATPAVQLAHAHGAEKGLAVLAGQLEQALQRLTRKLGEQNYRQLHQLLRQALQRQALDGETCEHREWIGRLLHDYYDPLYRHHLQRRRERVIFQGNAEQCREFLQTSCKGDNLQGG